MKKTFLCLALVFGSSAFLQAADWTSDYSAAAAQAKAQHKKLLLDFTGSDWCPACKLLESDVLTSKPFSDFLVQEGYIPVTIDFPVQTKQPDALAKQNSGLQDKYRIDGFPTLLVLDPDGKELARHLGYSPSEGTNGVISELQKAAQK